MFVKYNLYPTLLNEFAKYQKKQDDNTKKALLNRINRIMDFDEDLMRRMKRGSSFEKAVMSDISSEFDINIIQKVREMLPQKHVAQKKVSFVFEDIYFYGFADVVGDKKVIDIKTTSSYSLEKYAHNFQMLYLYALKDMGCQEMQYIIYDFNQVHVENYALQTYDFEPLLKGMKEFCLFLEENRALITDKKIFSKPEVTNLFS